MADLQSSILAECIGTYLSWKQEMNKMSLLRPVIGHLQQNCNFEVFGSLLWSIDRPNQALQLVYSDIIFYIICA